MNGALTGVGLVTGVTRRAMLEIVNFIHEVLDNINDEEKDRFVDILIEAYKNGRKILVVGAGRSGLVGKAFAMRLLHLGFNVYVLGETIVPSINKGDIVIAISGSGRTRLVITATEAAKAVGATVISLTTFYDSPLSKLSDLIVRIPGRTKIAEEEDFYARQIRGIHESLAPLGTLFEDVTMVFLDGVIAEIMVKLGKTEEDLKKQHANIE